jgi:hypothetical protein
MFTRRARPRGGSPSDSRTLFPCPFRHDPTLQHYRLPSITKWGSSRTPQPARLRSLLPPSGGPTQVGTTPSLMFRAMIVANGKVEMQVAV